MKVTWVAELRHPLLGCSLRKGYESSSAPSPRLDSYRLPIGTRFDRLPPIASAYHPPASVGCFASNSGISHLLQRTKQEQLHLDALRSSVYHPHTTLGQLLPSDRMCSSVKSSSLTSSEANSEVSVILRAPTTSGIWQFSWSGTHAQLHLTCPLCPLPCSTSTQHPLPLPGGGGQCNHFQMQLLDLYPSLRVCFWDHDLSSLLPASLGLPEEIFWFWPPLHQQVR